MEEKNKKISQSSSVLLPHEPVNRESKSDVEQMPSSRSKSKMSTKKANLLFIVLFLLAAFVSYFAMVGYSIYKNGISLYNNINLLADSAKNQDIGQVKQNLVESKNSLIKLESSYKQIQWTSKIPFVRKYVDDGTHALNASKHGMETLELVVDVVEPYSDILGLLGSSQNLSSEQTAKDRLDFLVKTLPDVIAKSDELIQKINLIDTEISHINPEDYPEKIGTFKLREIMSGYISAFKAVNGFAADSKPLLEVAPYLLGSDEARYYMIIFQNDKELRPTGGFMTAYTLAKVENGNFEPILSSDIYDLDNNYIPTIGAPEPIIKYIKGPYTILPSLRLRDMNWSPDFKESMQLFTNEAKKAGIKEIDGIIAVDTEVLVKLIDAIGPIPVPGYGEYTTNIVSECNCPQVIYELESFADVEGPIVWSENEPGKIVFAPENYDDRKKIIGPLMNALLSSALNQPAEKIPFLFEAGINSLIEKHALFYMYDEKAQAAIESAGIGGKIEDSDKDYLHINDSNLGGRKSNMYVTQEVNQEISILGNNEIEKTVTITYRNPEKYDGWLNSVLPNWVRVYVPEGSELISVDGLIEKVEPYNDLGKTVFAGYFELRPQGVSKVTIKYKLPFKIEKNEYKIDIQKQPGKKPFVYSISLPNESDEFELSTDKKLIYIL